MNTEPNDKDPRTNEQVRIAMAWTAFLSSALLLANAKQITVDLLHRVNDESKKYIQIHERRN